MAQAKPRILVVDDEANVRLTVQEALLAEGYEVETAKNGRKALERHLQRPFDLLLLDLRMPQMGGLETMRALEEVHNFPRIIIMTAFSRIKDVADGIRHGALEFLQKPFTPAGLREAVARVLQRPAHSDAYEDYEDYDTILEAARDAIRDEDLDRGLELARRANELAPTRPEPFNLQGVVFDLRNDWMEAAKDYQLAWNWSRTTSQQNGTSNAPSP
jgi:DNA-binding NtrC family response regulator